MNFPITLVGSKIVSGLLILTGRSIGIRTCRMWEAGRSNVIAMVAFQAFWWTIPGCVLILVRWYHTVKVGKGFLKWSHTLDSKPTEVTLTVRDRYTNQGSQQPTLPNR